MTEKLELSEKGEDDEKESLTSEFESVNQVTN